MAVIKLQSSDGELFPADVEIAERDCKDDAGGSGHREGDEVKPLAPQGVELDDLNYKTGHASLHTIAVVEAIANQAQNAVLGDPAHINPTEKKTYLSRQECCCHSCVQASAAF